MADSSKKIFADEIISEVRRTWNLINADSPAVGVDILLRLFVKHPTYQQLFNSFKDVPIDELKTKNEFLKHAAAIIEALNKAVEALDDAEKLVPLLVNVGKSHARRNVTPAQFSNIEPIILEAIQQALKAQCTENVRAAWKAVLSVAISTISKGVQG